MKAMIMDMCILSHKTQCFLLLGHVVDVGAGKLRCFTVILPLVNYVTIYVTVHTNRCGEPHAINTIPQMVGSLLGCPHYGFIPWRLYCYIPWYLALLRCDYNFSLLCVWVFHDSISISYHSSFLTLRFRDSLAVSWRCPHRCRAKNRSPIF